jgi:transmembrane sensor
MTAATPSQEDMDRLEQAADWVQVLSRNRHDDHVVESWLEWCGRDPRNQQAFEEISTIWSATAQLGAVTGQSCDPGGTLAEPASESQSHGMGAASPASTAHTGLRPASSATAAHRAGLSRMLTALAATVFIAIGAGFAYWALQQTHGDRSQTIVSPIGVRSTSELPDGSIMDLGGRTSVRLLYSDTLRKVDMLDGEVYLTVSKDKHRAFVVTAGSVSVTAVGTAFNVRRDADRVVVTVTEGVVTVARDSNASPARLTVNQQLAYVRGSDKFEIATVDPSIATAWRTGVLQFVDEPLGSVVASINRYSPRTITIRDREIESLSFTGTVHPDRIDHWLRALEKAFPLSVVTSNDQDVTLLARP